MKKKIIFILGIIVFSTYSCQKALLYPPLPTSISNQDYAPFSTPARITAQVLALYSNLRSGQLLGGRYQIYNDVKAENWINATNNSVTAYQTWLESVNSGSSEVLNLWTQCYFAINNANLFIDGMAASGNTVLNNPALAANYVAEAKFVRAVAYYCLLQMYCPSIAVNGGASLAVPLRLIGASAYGNYDMAPSTVAQVYAQVIKDLNDAETGLPVAYYTTGTTLDPVSNTTRAHKNTAIAYKTRVYLSMQQYTNAVTEAKKIAPQLIAPFSATTGVPNALQVSIANVFKSPYTTTESIFSMPFVNATEVPGGQNALADYFNTVSTTEFYLNPAGVVADTKWKSTDARRALVSTVSGKNYITKYALGSPFVDWAPVIRYSEVLLNYAEAQVRATNTLDLTAINLLNAVRGRSDATTVYTVASFPGGVPDLLAAIVQERNIEFLGEGLRWADLLRLGLPIPAKGAVASVPANDPNNYIWPVPSSEQSNNKLIGR